MPAEMQMIARMMLISVAIALPSCSGIVSGLGQVSPQIESQVNNKANAKIIVFRKNRKFMLVKEADFARSASGCFVTVTSLTRHYCSQGGTSALGAVIVARNSASVRTSLPR